MEVAGDGQIGEIITGETEEIMGIMEIIGDGQIRINSNKKNL